MINTTTNVNNQTLILDLITKRNNQLTTTDICEITKLHRDTVYSNCKELTRKGYIKKDGKFGKYYLTLEAYEKPKLKGYDFIREVTRTIQNSRISLAYEEERQVMNNLIEKYNEIIQNIDKKNNEIDPREWYDNVIQKELLSFSILMGSYTTYVFLQALKQEHIKNTISDSDINSEYILSWLKNSINPSYLFTLFKKLNIVSRNDLDTLIKCYEKIFPNLYSQFENINKRMNQPEKERTEDEIYDEPTRQIHEPLDKRKDKIKEEPK